VNAACIAFHLKSEALAMSDGSDCGTTIAMATTALLTSCGLAEEPYTLYRNSVLDQSARIHVASFDAVERNPYNMENCFVARDLFAGQPGVTVRYWCEKGHYKK
jgi:hypothetical protein